MPEAALVTPALLKWARTSMRMDVAEAASKAKVKPELLAEWERGVGHPSLPQARRLASVYKRPLAALFLPVPPRDFTVPHDFRRLPDVEQSLSPRLIEAIRLAEYRRSTALDLADPEEGRSDLAGIGSLDDDPERLAASVRKALGIRLVAQRRWRGDEYEGLNSWKSAVEAHSVLVFHFSRVPLEEARAFSIADDRFPVVAINGADRPRPRTFSLMHELCHVVVARGGISDFHERGPDEPDTRVEVFCNRFAGALLVPRDALLNESLVRGASGNREWTDDELSELAGYYSVSREVILRRLLTLGKTSESYYQRVREEMAPRDRGSPEREGGFLTPSRGAVRSVGQPFARLVLNAYYEDAITLSDVSEYLGVRVKHVPVIEALLAGRNVLAGGDH